MKVRLANRQQDAPVPVAWLTTVTTRAVKALKIRDRGELAVSCLDAPTMRRMNRRYTGHRGLTDVLSFRYDGEPVIGEILVSPRFAKTYAAAHGLVYRQELARYVIHGLLHWLGHDDRTAAQQRRMRRMEDRLLTRCT